MPSASPSRPKALVGRSPRFPADPHAFGAGVALACDHDSDGYTLTDFRLRPATPGDLPALGRLGALLVETHYGFDRERFIMPQGDLSGGYAEFLGGELERDSVVILVAEREGAIVGYVYAGIEPHSWKELRDVAGFIHDVAVDESARGRGIATALVEAASVALEGRGVQRVMLWSAARNAVAQRLFERLGFRRTMVEMTREARPAGA